MDRLLFCLTSTLLAIVGWVFALVEFTVAPTCEFKENDGLVIPIENFERELKGWKYVGGEEFPGSKGAFGVERLNPHGGTAAYRLDADFSGGGAYVGCWLDLHPLALPDISEFRLWVQTQGLDALGVRIVDSTGQCHQKRVTLPKGSPAGWQELVLKVRDLVGGEHWDGANDGAWHGPPRGLGLNIGHEAVTTRDSKKAALRMDDLVAVAVKPGTPTLTSCQISPSSCRPGYGTTITYTWDAEPLGVNCSVFVHFLNAQGQMVFQADHDPPVATTQWNGRVEYSRTATVPTSVPAGRYDIMIGFWNPSQPERGGGRKPFKAGEGLTARPDNACIVGSLEIRNDAPLPELPPKTLNLDDFRMTFNEDFRETLSVSPWGPGTRWIAHTPYAGDFGDAGFADPGPNSPFSQQDGILKIEARKMNGRWQSGLLCSVDPKGTGFSQKYGYFEMRAKFPKGLGTWPAFWLMGVPQLQEPRDKKTLTQVEIDVVEQYGVGPQALHTTVHLWGPGTFHWAEGDTTIVSGMTEDFHDYGVLVEEDFITFYFDQSEIRKVPTPKESRVPLYLMVDLALGGGWPTDQTPDPSSMQVDHVRVFARK